MMRRIYRTFLGSLDLLLSRLHVTKMFVTEWWAIWVKRSMYQQVSVDSGCRLSFDEFWTESYGKKISDRWHRLYASINSVFDKEYIPDVLFASKIEPRFNPFKYAVLYGDKSLTELLYSAVDGVVFPETIAVMADGLFYDRSRRVVDGDECIEHLSKESEFVIKPLVGGSSGQGVTFVRKGDCSAAEHLGRVRHICLSFGRGGFIAQRVLRQHESYRNIYPDSVNTIRLITFIASGGVRVAPICLRIGQGGSKVDNIHAGGLGVGVDEDGSLLSVAYELGYSDSKARHLRHPDTNVEFANYRVEGIGDMISKATQLHGCTPRMGMISWDLMLNEDGRVTLVEANYLGQAVWFPQILHGKPVFGRWTKDVLASVRSA